MSLIVPLHPKLRSLRSLKTGKKQGSLFNYMSYKVLNNLKREGKQHCNITNSPKFATITLKGQSHSSSAYNTIPHT